MLQKKHALLGFCFLVGFLGVSECLELYSQGFT